MNITPDMIDYIGYIAAFFTTASFLPQAILTIKTKDTQSLSLGMYTLFTLGVFGWLVYGICIANKAIIVANVITFILAASILIFKIYNVLTNKE
jgi:MtN3 and saliva related transmembrane protein